MKRMHRWMGSFYDLTVGPDLATVWWEFCWFVPYTWYFLKKYECSNHRQNGAVDDDWNESTKCIQLMSFHVNSFHWVHSRHSRHSSHSCHSCIDSLIHSLIDWLIHSFIYSFIHSFIHSFIDSFIHSFIHSSISFIYFTPSFLSSFIPFHFMSCHFMSCHVVSSIHPCIQIIQFIEIIHSFIYVTHSFMSFHFISFRSIPFHFMSFHSFICLLIRSFSSSFAHWFIHLLIHWFIEPFVQSSIHSCISMTPQSCLAFEMCWRLPRRAIS